MMVTNATSDAINTSRKGVHVYMCKGTNICTHCMWKSINMYINEYVDAYTNMYVNVCSNMYVNAYTNWIV